MRKIAAIAAALLAVILCVALIAMASNLAQETPARDGVTSSEEVKPAEMYLVFRIGGPDAGTPAFLCKAPEDKLSVADVFEKGEFFRQLPRLLIYAREREMEAALKFDAVARLSDGPGPFADFPVADRKPALAKERTMYPDMKYCVPAGDWYGSKLKGYKGGFLWGMPSGAVPDENWALGLGTYVRDLDEYAKHHKNIYKNEVFMVKLEGKILE